MSAALSLAGCTHRSDLNGFVVILFQLESQHQVVAQPVGTPAASQVLWITRFLDALTGVEQELVGGTLCAHALVG